MIDATDDLPVIQQAKLLKISRGTVYYKAQVTTEADLKLMRRMDKLHLDYPLAGSCILASLCAVRALLLDAAMCAR